MALGAPILPLELDTLVSRRAPDRLARAARDLPRCLWTPLALTPPGDVGGRLDTRVRGAALVPRHDDAHARRAAVVGHLPLSERHDLFHPRPGRRDATRAAGAGPHRCGVRARLRLSGPRDRVL